MEPRTQELVAVGAAVAAHCEPCLRYHLNKAREQGLAESEIAEAIQVARTVRKGAQANMDRAVNSLLQASSSVPDEQAGTASEPTESPHGQRPRFCCG